MAALLTSGTRREAARKAHVSESTIYNYLQDPVFSEEYENRRKQLITDASDQIQRGLAPAISTLREIAEDVKASKNARVAAARALIEYGIRLAEITDIYKRIDRLEEQAKEGENGL